LARSDAVIVCGGLGPTQDDITREAIAEVMGVELVRDESIIEVIRAMFGSRGREMPENNLRQADVPAGGTAIPNPRGTAPGLICPVGDRVILATPGVPHEMRAMMEAAVIPELQARAGTTATILSRTLRTWGMSESGLAEAVASRLDALEASGNPTIAFLASGIEGIKVRITAKAADGPTAHALLDAEEAELRGVLGNYVFGVDDETMETAVARLLVERGLTLAVAESVTGGLVGARLTAVPGASDWFKGAIVSYDSQVKYGVLGVPEGPVVTGEAATAMAEGVAKLMGADVGLAVTGVAGPAEQEGRPVGTVYLGVAMTGTADAVEIHLPGDRERIRQFAAISLLDWLRHRLVGLS
jgi:nicotinamide-nucleotide amidase